ncbi:MAG: Wzz/FepE/Etk N-terminal domain-containing protein [SAR86 cluster bacterium]|nr:Wzz/FepE/Etk N-terminal domain-containing protein [SAR86 cluster bacterium]
MNDINEKANEINISNIIRLLWNSKVSIISITAMFSISAVFYSLSLDNYFNSKALLAPVNSDGNNQSSLLSQYSGIASLTGIQLPQGSQNKTDLAIQKIQSKSFFKHLLELDNEILPSIMAPLSYNNLTGILDYNPELYTSSSKKWIREVKAPFKTIPSIQESHQIFLQMLSISKDESTGFVSISIEHLSPIFAHDLLKIIISEINELSRMKDLSDSRSALDFLTIEAAKNSLSLIDNSISNLIAVEIEKQMLSQISQNYIFEYIDEPYIPETKSGPNRAIICILSFFAGFVLSSLLALFKSDLFLIRLQKN